LCTTASSRQTPRSSAWPGVRRRPSNPLGRHLRPYDPPEEQDPPALPVAEQDQEEAAGVGTGSAAPGRAACARPRLPRRPTGKGPQRRLKPAVTAPPPRPATVLRAI
jgi:hypothetical protein